MKTLRSLITVLIFLALGVFVTPASADTTPTLTKSGVTLSFPSPVYEVISATSVITNYTNNSGYELSSLSYELTDKFGTIVAGTTSSAYNVKNGSSGNLKDTWFSFEIDKSAPPYKITMKISYLFGSGKSDEFISAPFEFMPRVANLPTPTPTVTATYTPLPVPTVTITSKPVQSITAWATLESLKAELAIAKNDLNAVKAKLTKICSTKPKPKGC